MTSDPLSGVYHTIPETAAILKISERGVYNKIAAVDLKTVHVGRRVFVINLRTYLATLGVTVDAGSATAEAA